MASVGGKNAEAKRVLWVLSLEERIAYNEEIQAARHEAVKFLFETSPEDALEDAPETKPDLVVVGMTHDEMDGLEFLAHLMSPRREFTGRVIVLPEKDDPYPPVMHWRTPDGKSATQELTIEEIGREIAGLAPRASRVSQNPTPEAGVDRPKIPLLTDPKQVFEAATVPPPEGSEDLVARTRSEEAIPSRKVSSPDEAKPTPVMPKPATMPEPARTSRKGAPGAGLPGSRPSSEVADEAHAPVTTTRPDAAPDAGRDAAGDTAGDAARDAARDATRAPAPSTPSTGRAPPSPPARRAKAAPPASAPVAAGKSPVMLVGIAAIVMMLFGSIVIGWMLLSGEEPEPADPVPEMPELPTARPESATTAEPTPAPVPEPPPVVEPVEPAAAEEPPYEAVLPATFDSGDARYDITDEEEMARIVERVRAALEDEPEALLEIGGHTSPHGSDSVNERLGRSRAERFRRYFVEEGVPLERIVLRNYHSSEPVEDAPTQRHRMHRRVTVRILE